MHDTIDPAQVFTCQKCGECCRGYGGTFVTDRDIVNISKYLNIDSHRFVVDYCELSGGKPILAQRQSGYCLFWDKLCTIHPVKPKMCRIWPFIESLLVDASNWKVMASSCPGIRIDLPDRWVSECVKNINSTLD